MTPFGYKQTEIGVIPEDWDIGSLKEAFQRLDAGVSVNSDESAYSDYFVLKTSAVRNGIVNAKEAKPVVRADYPRLKCPVKKGSIIISRMNTPAMVGECGFSAEEAPYTFLPDRLWQVEPSAPDYDFQWLNYLLNTEKYSAAIRATATGTSNSMKNIAKDRLLEILIPKPTLREQQRIAEALSDMDELIASLEKLIAKKKAIKQGAMQELLTGKRRIPGFRDPWVHVTISDLAEVFSGGTPNTSVAEYWGGAIPWMNSGELNLKIVRQVQGRITQKGYDNSSTHYIPANCVLIGLAGQGKTRGTAAFNTFSLCTNQSIAAIYPNPDKYDSKFLYYLMDTQYDNLRELSSGDGGRGGLTKSLLLNFSLTIPANVSEQEAIATFLTDIDSEIEHLEHKYEKSRQIKQGMMQQLLTGKIRLR